MIQWYPRQQNPQQPNALGQAMALAKATNGVYGYKGQSWVGSKADADVKANGAVYCATYENVLYSHYLGMRKGHYVTRLSKESPVFIQVVFYVKRGQPWKEMFDLAIL